MFRNHQQLYQVVNCTARSVFATQPLQLVEGHCATLADKLAYDIIEDSRFFTFQRVLQQTIACCALQLLYLCIKTPLMQWSAAL